MNEAMITPIAANAPPPDLSLLAKRVADLSTSVDFWNAVMIWGLALAALAALVIGWSTRRVIVISGELSNAQGDLSTAKESLLKIDLKAKDGKIAEAMLEAAKSNERAVKLEATNLHLAQQIASTGNRNLVILAAQEKIAESLKEFAGQEFEMAYSTPDFADIENVGTRSAIAGTLKNASSWVELPERGTGAWTEGIKIFFRSDASSRTRLAAQKLEGELNKTLGKREVGNLRVGSVGMGTADPTVDSGIVSTGKDVILILVGPHT